MLPCASVRVGLRDRHITHIAMVTTWNAVVTDMDIGCMVHHLDYLDELSIAILLQVYVESLLVHMQRLADQLI